MNKTAASAAQ